MDPYDSYERPPRQRPVQRKRTSGPSRSGSASRFRGESHDAPPRSTRDAGAAGVGPNAHRTGSGTGRAHAGTGRGSGDPRARAHASARGVKRAPARKAPRRRSRTRAIWRLVLLVFAVLAVVGVVGGAVALQHISKNLPDITKSAAPLAETSIIYDRNGKVLTELFAEQNRTYVPLAKIPVQLRQGVIATEDQRFYQHEGVDPMGIARALWVNATKGKHHGGSTITQQYVVNTFIKRENSLMRKVKEALLAYRVESKYTKDQILERYLNTIYFGHGAYGVQAAAETYFGKDPSALSTAECAMIAGLIKSPGDFSPRVHPDAARNRRNTVLGQMLKLGFISQAQHDAAEAEPFKLAQPKASASTAPYFVEWIKQTLITKYGPDTVFKGGLRVKTTIDTKMQAAAEHAVATTLNRPSDPSAALVAIDPKTGAVRALVGGKDFSTQQFNVAVQGPRQTGSSFKPFVLVTALEQGISPEQTYQSAAASFATPNGQAWKVTGAPGGGLMRLRVATAKSINSVYAQLILAVGADKVAETAKKMGVTAAISPVPAIALGSGEVTPLDMASAYGTLADGGVHVDPHGIVEVKDLSGKVLYSAPKTSTQAISPAVAYLATDILKGVITSGTGTAAKIGRPAAGKTGTTQEYRDAWFVGYTPDLVASVWVGHTEGQVAMTNVHGKKVTGGTFPAQIWASFMKDALKGTPSSDFKVPKGITTDTICLETGGLASPFCPTKGTVPFLVGHEPLPCPLHSKPAAVDVPNLIGTMKADALATLKALGLFVKVQEKAVAGVPAGMVSDQSPKYGGQIDASSTISIIVSTGEPKNSAPVAAFKFTPASPKANAAVAFDASSSSDSDGVIVKYMWEFGDGSTSVTGTQPQTTHVFTATGKYTVTLWVTDDRGKASSLPLTVEVK